MSAGKGDKRRKGADDKAYSKGWERIFGQKSSNDRKKEKQTNDKKKTY
jgi:hypothetical protein